MQELQETVFDVSARRLRAYMACALTNLTEEQRGHAFFLSDCVATVCLEFAIDLYEPRKNTDPVHNSEIPDSQVYLVDRQGVALSDLMIMLCDYPSNGAGQELEIAALAGVPTILLISKDGKISRMTTGSFAEHHRIEYNDPDDLKVSIRAKLQELVPTLQSKPQEELGNVIAGRLAELRAKHGMTIESLAKEVGYSVKMITALETTPERVSNAPILLLRRLSAALGVTVGDLVGDSPYRYGNRVANQSIQNLERYADRVDASFKHYQALRDQYLQDFYERPTGYLVSRTNHVVSDLKWQERHARLLKAEASGQVGVGFF